MTLFRGDTRSFSSAIAGIGFGVGEVHVLVRTAGRDFRDIPGPFLSRTMFLRLAI